MGDGRCVVYEWRCEVCGGVRVGDVRCDDVEGYNLL